MVTDPHMVAEVLRQPDVFDKNPDLGRSLSEVQPPHLFLSYHTILGRVARTENEPYAGCRSLFVISTSMLTHTSMLTSMLWTFFFCEEIRFYCRIVRTLLFQTSWLATPRAMAGVVLNAREMTI